MKPFELETVLRYRKRLKDIARNKYEDAKKNYLQAKKLLAEKKIDYASLVTKLAELQRHGISIQDHILYETRLDFLSTEIKMLRDDLEKKHEVVIKERTFLMQKSKEQQVMEKLKENQNREWQRYLEKKEAAVLDEFAVLYRKK